MRLRAIGVLALAALLATGCVTYIAAPTPAPTPAVTEPPTLAPTLPPTQPPTEPPTAAPTRAPTPTLAPGQTPLPTAVDLRPFLASGITLYNLGDAPLFVTATGIDPDSKDEFLLGEFEVQPEQFTRQASIPLLMRFDFSYSEGTVDDLGTCTMNVASGSEVDFVAVAGGVVVTVNQVQPDDIAEMSITTSSLCQAGQAE
jgi:hypothetical protein